MGKLLGRIKEMVGFVTGDRASQRGGRVETRAADPADPLSQVSDEAVAHEEHQVREEEGDVEPGSGTDRERHWTQLSRRALNGPGDRRDLRAPWPRALPARRTDG